MFRSIALLLCCVSTLFLYSPPVQAYLIYQDASGRVIFFGDDNGNEHLLVRNGDQTNSLRIQVLVGPNYSRNYEFTNVTGLFVDFDGNSSSIGVDTVTLLGATINGDVELISSEYCEDLRLTTNSFFGTTTINGDVFYQGTSGSDIFRLTDAEVAGSVHFEGKQDNDRFTLEMTDVGGQVDCRTGVGDGHITLDDCNIQGTLNLRSANGKDDVLIDFCDFHNSVNVRLGSNHDDMLVLNSIFRRSAWFDAGHGNDEGNQGGNQFPGKSIQVIRNFEMGNFGN